MKMMDFVVHQEQRFSFVQTNPVFSNVIVPAAGGSWLRAAESCCLGQEFSIPQFARE